MLQFIFGRSASGKTETIYRLVSNENSENSIVIVPEQYTFETEKSLLKKGCSNVSVYSFSRLVEITQNIYGGFAGDRLDEFNKVVLMMRVLRNLEGSLCVYRKFSNSLDFAVKLVNLLDEFKESAVSLDDLNKSLDDISLGSTKSKLSDLIKIFHEYNSIIENEFLDPADDLKRLHKTVNDNKFFKDKIVYLDGFKGFHNSQLRILKCILRDAKKVYITFNCDPIDIKLRKDSLYHNIYLLIDKIERFAEEYGCEVLKPIELKESFYTNEELVFFEKNIFNNSEKVFDKEVKNISLLQSNNASEMIDNVLLLIRRLVRTKGYKYSDFVIIARNIDKYDRYISSYSNKYNVPIFLDKRRSLKHSPIARVVLSSIHAANTLKSDAILEYLKCGLNIISENELQLLEDYVYIWKITDNWNNSWNMSPKGLEPFKDEKDREECSKLLSEINTIREKVVAPLFKLKEGLCINAQKNCKAIYQFLKDIKISKLLTDHVNELEKLNNTYDKEFCISSYDSFIEVISSLYNCLKNDTFKINEFIKILNHALVHKTVGTIPQMIDEVSCGSADRIRPARPKVCFLIGVNQFEFPASIGNNDILLNSDRQALIDCNIDIIDKASTYLYNENFLVYSSACCPSEKLFICSHSGFEGNPPSQIVNNCKRKFPKVKTIDLTEPEKRIETIDNSFTILAEIYNNNEKLKNALLYIYNNSEYKNKLFNLSTSLEQNKIYFSKEFCDKHLNKDLNMSASRIDAFYKCRFNYLFKYILYLNKARPAEIDVLNRGTIVHYVLENIIKKYKNKISAVSKEETIKEVDFYMIEYLKSMEAEDLLHDIRFKYIYDKISTLAKRTMFRIIEEFSNSDFKPEFCEFSIGNDIPPLEIKGENNIKIIGYIDRVDLLENEQNKYVRIVDYKSSNMKISINNILYGLNLQMLIYLYAYTKNSNAIPAGVFYLPVNGGFTDTNPTMKMNGLMLNDLDIYQSMDNNNTGKFLPNFGSKERRDNPLIEQDDFDIVFKYIESKIKDMENTILNGDFNISPVDLGNGTSCKYCDFKSICRIENEGLINKVDTSLDTNNAIDYMKGKINGV